MKPFKNEKLNTIYNKLINRETISYLIAGVLTTIINMGAYNICYYNFKMENLIANAVAWVIAVIFAYIVNDKFVFQSKKQTAQKELEKMGKFFGARVVSFLFDEAGMFIMVDLCGINGNLSKLIVNIFVVIINYVFSKLFIFNQPKEEEFN